MKITKRIKIVTYTIIELLVIILLCFTGFRENLDVYYSYHENEYIVLEQESSDIIERADAPLDTATAIELNIGELVHDTNLTFYTYHSMVEVYIEDELIYSLKPASDISPIKTTGSNWNTIPIDSSYAGKRCQVILMPIYADLQDFSDVNFLLGSQNAVFVAELKANLVETIIIIIVLLICIAFLVLGIFFRIKVRDSMNFISLGFFGLCLSLWRLCDMTYTPLLVGENHIFLYCVSLTMLILSMIPLLEAVKRNFRKDWNIAFDVLSIIISITGIVQLVLQLTGVFDLREMLFVTHITIVASMIAITVCLIMQFIKPSDTDTKRLDSSVFIVVGFVADIIIFYIRDSSLGLVFSLLGILLFVMSEGVRFVLRYLDKEKKLAESEIRIAHNETKLAESRFTTMMSQIRSHFIFNILNAISGMCKYDPEKADKTIVHFARFLRSNIDIMQNNDLVHFHNALRHIEDYVALEQVRYGDNIQFVTDLQEDNFMLPPLVMQPIVENAIIHGLTPKSGGGTITLRTRKDADNIYIIIEDDGVGYDSSVQASEKSIGLQNIRFRLKHMVNGTLNTESIVNIGTKTTITIPRKEAEICG